MNHKSINIKIFCLAIIFYGLFGLAKSSQAATKNAASCRFADVQAACNSAASGDVIIIPSCAQTDWGANTLEIDKSNLTVQGQGVGNTIISGSDTGIYPKGELANGLRITGIEFRNFNMAIYNYNNHDEGVKNLRVDHCKFLNNAIVFNSYGHITGVFDHDVFEDISAGFRIFGDDNATATFPFVLGTSDAIFVEDSTLLVNNTCPSHFITSRTGSRYVIRHNTFTYNIGCGWVATIDAHGMCEGSDFEQRGSFTFEVYNNTINGTAGANGKTFQFRGGQGVVFNNNITSYNINTPYLFLDDYRVSQSDCATSCYQGCCTTYPCTDQINHTYVWNNTFMGGPLDVESCDENFIKLGRDYWTTDPGYVPYTYPHPLTQSGQSDTVAPSAPSGLTVQ